MKRAQLQVVPLTEACRLFFSALERVGFFVAFEEEIATSQSLGRVTSRAVRAQRAVPHFDSAAMDGIAVRGEQTEGASQQSPMKLVRGRDFEFIDTGEPIPAKFDAVIKIEDVQEMDAQNVKIEKSVTTGKHVRAIGEDFARNSEVVPAGCLLTPEAIAALLNAGNRQVFVKCKPKAIFIPTGSELVSAEDDPRVGEFPETNSQIVRGLVERWGGLVTVHEIVPNEAERIRYALRKAMDSYDLVLVGSGTSKGRRDLVPQIVQELGQILVHGVAYHPGHPVLLGMVKTSSPLKGEGSERFGATAYLEDGGTETFWGEGRGEIKPVIGLPGYPVATWLALWLFVRPLLERYYYGRERELFTVRAKLMKPIKSVLGYREFVRARLERAADGAFLVHPLQGGASKLSTIVRADGWVEVPEEVAAFQQDKLVEVVLLWR